MFLQSKNQIYRTLLRVSHWKEIPTWEFRFCADLQYAWTGLQKLFSWTHSRLYNWLLWKHTHVPYLAVLYNACICLPTDTLMAELVLTWYQTERMFIVVTHSAFYLCSHQVLYTHGSIHSQPSCVLLIKNVLESDCSRLFEMVVGLTWQIVRGLLMLVLLQRSCTDTTMRKLFLALWIKSMLVTITY